MIQQTSQLSLLDTIKEVKVNKRQQQILDLFYTSTLKTIVKNGYQPCYNNREIAELLKLPINSITPRVNELVKMGKLVEHKKMKDNITNRQTIYWRLA